MTRSARALMPGRYAAPASGRAGSERGMVLLETALAVPVLLAVAAALVWVIALASTALALGDAARAVARDLARGVPVADAIGQAEARVQGMRMEVAERGDAVVVIARADVSAPVPVLSGLTVPLEQTVAVPREWS